MKKGKTQKNKYAIEVNNVSKTFEIPTERKDSIKSYFLNPFHKPEKKVFHALNNINLKVEKGEFLGLIGRNGSGKSTLLKIIAGIYQPDEGEVKVNGSIVPFLELGVGFNPELSGRENVFLNGTILGMSKKFLERKFDEIVDFAEVEKFIDMPLKNYSSGMQVRLAFAIAIQAEADMYLLDEILAVGDADFKLKSINSIEKLVSDGKTILYVTHDLGSVEKICSKVLYLKDGKRVFLGNTQEALNKYIYQDKIEQKDKKDTRNRSKQNILKSITFYDLQGSRVSRLVSGEPMKIRIDYESESRIENPVFGIAFKSSEGKTIFGTNTELLKHDIKSIEGQGSIYFETGNCPIKDKQVDITVGLRTKGTAKHIDWREKLGSVVFQDHSGNIGETKIDFKTSLLERSTKLLASKLNKGKDRIEKFGMNNINNRKEEWDIILLLDGCRYDTFKNINFIKGDLQRVISSGSGTVEWFHNTFVPGEYKDLVYISSNPYISKIWFQKEKLDVTFYSLIELWDNNWDDKLKTVKPEAVIGSLKESINKFSNKKFIAHFMQPHHPFIGDISIDESGWQVSRQEVKMNKLDRKEKNVYEQLAEGIISREKVVVAYESNLKYVLRKIQRLLHHLRGKKVVITSDHGDCFGEYGVYAHPINTMIPELIEVPWFIVDGYSTSDVFSGIKI